MATISSPRMEMASSMDLLDALPDAMVLLVLSKLPDASSLCRCRAVCRRLLSLSSLVDALLLPLQQPQPPPPPPPAKPSSILSRVLLSLLSPFLPARLSPPPPPPPPPPPSELLLSFPHLRSLRILLPSPELPLDPLLRWSASFGSTLRSCSILAASSPHKPASDPFQADGGLKLRVVWTISSLIAASARHYLLRPIIADHPALESVQFEDAEGQGVLRMDRSQLEELRSAPQPKAGAAQRTAVPTLKMRLWYASRVEIDGGLVLEGATLVAIRPSGTEEEEVGSGLEGAWVADAFEGKYAEAARMLMKGKSYCLEMNSF